MTIGFYQSTTRQKMFVRYKIWMGYRLALLLHVLSTTTPFLTFCGYRQKLSFVKFYSTSCTLRLNICMMNNRDKLLILQLLDKNSSFFCNFTQIHWFQSTKLWWVLVTFGGQMSSARFCSCGAGCISSEPPSSWLL